MSLNVSNVGDRVSLTSCAVNCVSDAVIGAVDNIFGFGQRHGRGMRNNVDWLERKIMVYEKDEMNYKITAPLEFQRGFNLPRYICWRLSSFWS